MKAYKLKIELMDSDPLIWRRVIIPAGATFYRLYDTIQYSMGWLGSSLDEYHLYEFKIAEANLRIANDEEAIEDNKMVKARYKGKMIDKILDPFGEIERQLKWTGKGSRSVKIDQFMEPDREQKYTYDFGDNWQHRILVEAVIDDYPFGFPATLDGAGDCPPEDVGGIDGYYDFLKVYNNPKHRNHKKTVAWAEEQRFKPFDIEWSNTLLRMVKIHKTEWEAVGLGSGHYELTGHELDKYR